MPAAGAQHSRNASSGWAAQRGCQQRASSAGRMPAAGGQCRPNASSGCTAQCECQRRNDSAARMPAAEERHSSNASRSSTALYACRLLAVGCQRREGGAARMPAAGGQRRTNATCRSAVQFRCQQRQRVAKQLCRAGANCADPCTQKGSAPKKHPVKWGHRTSKDRPLDALQSPAQHLTALHLRLMSHVTISTRDCSAAARRFWEEISCPVRP
jgi:hypothetical protein